MLSNAYFRAKIRFDTAENEPDKNLQKFSNLPILLTLAPSRVRPAWDREDAHGPAHPRGLVPGAAARRRQDPRHVLFPKIF